MNTTPCFDTMQELTSSDHHAFGSGPRNPYGLQMRFYTDGELVYSRLSVPEHLRGWSTLVHGGVLTAILDEVMSWTAMNNFERLLLTRNISVSYRRPVPIETPILAVGYTKERRSERQAIMGGRILLDGKECVRAEGDFALFTAEAFGEMNILPPEQMDQLRTRFS